MTQRMTLWIGVILALGAVAEAEEPVPEPPGGASPTLHGALSLSLADAISMAIENNLDVEILRHAPLLAQEDHEIAWGAYDPESFAEFGYASNKNPNAFSLAATNLSVQRTTDGFAGVRGIVPFVGASYDLRFDSSRATSNSAVQAFSPELRSSFTLSATLPLLRGLIWNEAWTLVKTTGVASGSAREAFRRDLMDVLKNVQSAYWALVATEEGVRVAEKSREAAGGLLKISEVQYEVGVVSRVAVVEAEAGVADRDFKLIQATNLYQDSQDRLIDLVLGAHLTAASRMEIDPTDRPGGAEPLSNLAIHTDAEAAATLAFEHRPELEIARSAVQQADFRLHFARNQRLPRFDVQASYGNRGLAGDPNPNLQFGDPPLSSDYSSSFDDFFTSDAADQFTIRGILSFPLGNVQARHRLSRAELELRRSRTKLRRVRQDIVLEIRDALRDLRSAAEGIEAAERRRLAAAEQHRAEGIRLEHGESTPFGVLQREEDLVEAERQKIVALRDYRESVAELDRAQGTILRSHNVLVEDARALR